MEGRDKQASVFRRCSWSISHKATVHLGKKEILLLPLGTFFLILNPFSSNSRKDLAMPVVTILSAAPILLHRGLYCSFDPSVCWLEGNGNDCFFEQHEQSHSYILLKWMSFSWAALIDTATEGLRKSLLLADCTGIKSCSQLSNPDFVFSKQIQIVCYAIYTQTNDNRFWIILQM